MPSGEKFFKKERRILSDAAPDRILSEAGDDEVLVDDVAGQRDAVIVLY